MDYIISYRLDIDLPEAVAAALNTRCMDTGETLGEIAEKAIAHYLSASTDSINITQAMELSMEQNFNQNLFKRQVGEMTSKQKDELLLMAYEVIAIKDNMLRQLLSQKVRNDIAFKFGSDAA